MKRHLGLLLGVTAACNLVADLDGYEVVPAGGGGVGAEGGTVGGGGVGGIADGGEGGVGGQGGPIPPCGSACTGDHVWSTHIGGDGDEAITALTVDQTSGVTYVGGEFFSTIDFGTDSYTSPDAERDLFVAALDDQGTPTWTFATTSGDDDHLSGLTVDTDGHVIGVGQFENQTNIGGAILGNSSFDLLFFKLSSNDGSVMWAESRSGGNHVTSTAVATHPDGGLIVVGDFLTSLDLDGGPLSVFGGRDAFMAHFDGSGIHRWSQSVGGGGADRIMDVAVTSDGGFVVVGTADDAIDLGEGLLPYVGALDVFVAKYDKFAVLQWGKSFGGNEDDRAHAVATDDDGRVFVVGEFRQTISFGGETLTSMGDADAFVAVLDADGEHVYSARYGNEEFQVARALADDTFDNVLVGGEFAGEIQFGMEALSSGGTDRDIFVHKLAVDGTPRFSKAFGNPGMADQRVDCIRRDAAGDAVFAGTFTGTVNFGDGPENADAGTDAFVVKITK